VRSIPTQSIDISPSFNEAPPLKRARGKFKEVPHETWTEYKATGSIDLRNELIEHYLPLVWYQSDCLSVKLPNSVEKEDLFSAGVFGLMDAIEKYDLARKVKFKTYCALRIRGSMQDSLRQADWVPRLVRARAHTLEAAKLSLEAALGRPGSDLEQAKQLNLTMEEFVEMVRGGTAIQVVSLSDKWGEDQYEYYRSEREAIDLIPSDREPNPVDNLQRIDFMELVSSHLKDRERLIIMLYYFEELTMREIGLILGLSEARVCQLHARIIKKLREALPGGASGF
jgi:RNA polymerase sigma factor FliA